MFDIANNTEFLTTIGIADAPEETKARLIANIEDLAKQRLAVALSERLTETQLAEFDAINDEQQATDWLIANVPDLQDITANVLEEIKNDILARKVKKDPGTA